jgi:SAM-dependent methyltransferase
MRLNLGCSTTLEHGYVNVDIVEPADVICDLSSFPWPWEESSVSHIRAHDIIEHIGNSWHVNPKSGAFQFVNGKISLMNEAWRVLEPGGTFAIKVPTTYGPGAWCDPTHVSYWNRLSFGYFTKGTAEYERFHVAYGITACFEVVSERENQWPNLVVDLKILLKAVKP